LLSVLNDAGLDGHALMRDASREEVKEQLRKNTQRAQQAGVCGVPSFQINDGAVVWGQDRLNIVEDLLCGWKDANAIKANL
jgi:2-hydroxychromene-2-carboxylate isomerase